MRLVGALLALVPQVCMQDLQKGSKIVRFYLLFWHENKVKYTTSLPAGMHSMLAGPMITG